MRIKLIAQGTESKQDLERVRAILQEALLHQKKKTFVERRLVPRPDYSNETVRLTAQSFERKVS